jgi:hypothetical protein
MMIFRHCYAIITAVLLQATNAFVNPRCLKCQCVRAYSLLDDPVQIELLGSTSRFDSLGLLQGISLNTSQYYTKSLQMDSITDPLWLRAELGLPYEAAKKDATEQNIAVAEYLATVDHTLSTFMKSGEVP